MLPTTAETITFYAIVVAYSVAATLFFVDLARPERAKQSGLSLRVLEGALTLHVIRLGLQIVFGAVSAGSLKVALSLCAISVVGVYLLLRTRARIHAMGVVVAPLALTLLVGAEFLTATGPATDFPRTLLLMHIAASILGLGFFLLAGAAGGFYLFQERRLKEKRPSSLQGRLPPLDALDLTEHRLLLAGFPLLTFGIVIGAVFASRAESMTGVGLARSALAYASWILVAGVLVLRAVAGWRGRRAAYGTLAGVVCVLVVIFIYVAHSRSGGGL